MRDEGESLGASLHYRADLVSDEAADALLARYERLLGAIAARPDIAIAELEVNASPSEEPADGAGHRTAVGG